MGKIKEFIKAHPKLALASVGFFGIGICLSTFWIWFIVLVPSIWIIICALIWGTIDGDIEW